MIAKETEKLPTKYEGGGGNAGQWGTSFAWGDHTKKGGKRQKKDKGRSEKKTLRTEKKRRGTS